MTLEFEAPDVYIFMTYVCSGCGKEIEHLGNTVWIKHLCDCGNLDHHIQWQYTLYEEAKRIVGVLYTRKHQWLPACVVCGKTAAGWMAHHIVSQRHKAGHNDIRNLVPVCSQRCHTLAHSSKKKQVQEELYWVLGSSDTIKGHDVFIAGKRSWLPKTEGSQCPNSF